VSPEEWDFNLGVYYYSRGEAALDEWWRLAQEQMNAGRD